mmetsp:Transcript_94936/g.271432  ORF Transcript_94936/g.271432 Transcript_94936/m.271432 type:complete len:253 (-) Transcript_94936:269-1027(-)
MVLRRRRERSMSWTRLSSRRCDMISTSTRLRRSISSFCRLRSALSRTLTVSSPSWASSSRSSKSSSGPDSDLSAPNPPNPPVVGVGVRCSPPPATSERPPPAPEARRADSAAVLAFLASLVFSLLSFLSSTSRCSSSPCSFLISFTTCPSSHTSPKLDADVRWMVNLPSRKQSFASCRFRSVYSRSASRRTISLITPAVRLCASSCESIWRLSSPCRLLTIASASCRSERSRSRSALDLRRSASSESTCACV